MKPEEIELLSTRQLEDLIVEGEDLQTLYRCDILLEKRKSELYRDIEHEAQNRKKINLKSQLSWADNLLKICKLRQFDVQETSNKFNWHFRVEAQKQLPPDVYNAIADKAKYGWHG